MFNIKVLKMEETMKILKMGKVIETVKDVYRAKSLGDTEVFPLVFEEFEHDKAEMDIKSGWMKKDGIFGLKLVSWFAENEKKNIPTVLGTVMVFDAETGAPKGVVDGTYITGVRTGACGAIGAKLLAREDSKNLFVLGAGNQAAHQIAATMILFPNLEKVRVADMLSAANAKNFVKNLPERLKNEFGLDPTKVVFEATNDLADAIPKSDIVITVTPSYEPVIKKEWVKPGTHFSCIGSDMSGKEEIDPEIFRGARVFVDDIPQCLNVGEIEIPVKKGVIKEADIAGEIGDILAGKAEGRQNDDQITIFDATGVALLDLATAMLALEEAKKQNIGQSAEL